VSSRRTLNPRAPLPLYAQLRDILSDEIAQLAPGDRLPSEFEIVDRFSVSRATVRQAIAELESAGRVHRKRGFGTFVVHPAASVVWRLQSEQGWYEEMTRAGHKVSTRVLHLGRDAAPAWVVDALEMTTNVAIRLDRVRSIDNDVALFVQSYLHPVLCAAALEVDFTDLSLYTWLRENCELRVMGGTRTVRAVSASRREASLLELPAGAPLLYVEAVSVSDTQGPFECYQAWHRGDLASFRVVVGAGV